MKITIIGFSGSGKSTLAKFLANTHQLPVLHLDSVHWLPNWQERPLENKIDIVNDFLNNNKNWVIEGNYHSVCFDKRMEQADIIIVMILPAWQCYIRVLKRYIRYRNTTRPDMGEGCNEKIDWEFSKWVLKNGRQPKHHKRLQTIQTRYKEKVIVLRNQQQIDEFMIKSMN